MQRRWILARNAPRNGDQIGWAELCRSESIARILQRREFASAAEVEAFLDPRLDRLSDPFLLPGIEAAVRRILEAVDRHQRIVLFGDYDVDGVTSLALLDEMLRALGNAPALFLPHRLDEGYGMSREAVERCLRLHDPQLLIAIDCGTTSTNEIAELRRDGVDVIVLDHHEPKSDRPDCILVNPKAAPSDLRYLCSVGLTFKLCHALLKARRIPYDLRDGLDLVALGTVADIVPLEGENRALVKRGATQLARSRRPGLIALIAAAGVKPPITPEDIGFRLGPRLNAAGRLDTAEKALRLLVSADPGEAESLAQELDLQNRERQKLEKRILTEAEAQLGEVFDPARDAAIVLGARDWHPGVLGIVASRIARKYHRPTIVIGFDESGAGKGSGRSIAHYSLVQALGSCSSLLDKFGGHEMAAGVSLSEQNFGEFAQAFRSTARAQLDHAALEPRLHLDAEILLRDVNFELLHWHDRLQPFGQGNLQPLFVSSQVEPAMIPRVVGERHLSLRLKQRNWQQRAIFFDGVSEPLPPPPWDVAYRIVSDVYEGEQRIQLQLEALRSSCAFD
ncbi:MAG: single-stranded-DNA-specific exonuclease RecJ [Verrucomicrobiota bacterium]